MAIIDDVDLEAAWGAEPTPKPLKPRRHQSSLKRRLDGDTFVIARHSAHLSERVRRNLWALGLWSTGDAVTIDSSSLSNRGKVYVARDDVLLVAATAESEAAWMGLPWARQLLTAPRSKQPDLKRYQSADRPAGLMTFENGEFARCESTDELVTLKWSSALPPRTLLSAVAGHFPGTAAQLSAHASFTEDEFVDGNLGPVAETASEFASELDTFRIRSNVHAFGWMARLSTHDKSKDVVLNQCAVSSKGNISELLPLFVATATPALGSSARRVFKLISDLTLGVVPK